jgi:hypothetical protein
LHYLENVLGLYADDIYSTLEKMSTGRAMFRKYPTVQSSLWTCRQARIHITLAVELAEQGLSHTMIVAHLGRHRETIGVWLKGIATYGLSGFLERHTQAKKDMSASQGGVL